VTRHDPGVRRPWTAASLGGVADVVIPWGVGIFYVLVALGERNDGAPIGVFLLLLGLSFFEAGPLAEGGYRVHARLPLEAVP
jgi:hypothetical protein